MTHSKSPTTEGRASSVCPVCYHDKPHAHTRHSIATEYREKWLQAKFEKWLTGWFADYGHLIPGSYGMSIHLRRKSENGVGTYAWWPVEMMWVKFRYGVSLFEPPWPDHGVPDVNEALEIKEYPFGKERGRIEYD